MSQVVRIIIFAVLLADAFVTARLSNAQVGQTSEVVGYYTFDVINGTNLVVSGLVGRKLYEGTVSLITPGGSTTTLTLSGNGLTAGALNDVGGVPTHYAELVVPSHNSEGLIMDIQSNTSNEIVLHLSDAEAAASGLQIGDAIYIHQHVTLKSFFESADDVTVSDRVQIYDENGVHTRYVRAQGNWYVDPTLDDANNVVIYPGQGFVFDSVGSASHRIGGAGVSHVKARPTRIALFNGGINLAGMVNPLNGSARTLAETGLQNSLSSSDRVEVYDIVGGQLVLVGRYAALAGNWYEDPTLILSNDVEIPLTSALNISSVGDRSGLINSGL